MRPRTIGVLWLGCIVTSIVNFVVWSNIVKTNDAAATATNILAHETLFRWGFITDLASAAFYVGVTALLFYLLRPVSPSASLVAAFFGITGIAIGGVGLVSHFAPLILLNGKEALSGLTTIQLQAAALVALRLQFSVFNIGMVCFGVQCITVGWLIIRSGYIPKALGVLLGLGGAGYILSSVATLVSPSLGPQLSQFILPIALIGEGSLTVWLLI